MYLNRCCVLPLLAVVSVCAAFKSELDSHWIAYKSLYEKGYSTDEEADHRAMFEQNINFVNSQNLREDVGLQSYRLGLNQFSDMTKAEIEAFFVSLNATEMSSENQAELDVPSSDVPDSIDWRTKSYTTVKNEGTCGACYAFSVLAAIEGHHFAKTNKQIILSEQHIIDCSTKSGNQGCKSGSVDATYKYIMSNGGVATQESYPYSGKDAECQFKKEMIGSTISGYVHVKDNEDELKKVVGTVGPVSVIIDATSQSFLQYKNGIYDDPQCDSNKVNHAVAVVGYGSENGKDYWILRNSFGTSWGEEGYMRLARNKNGLCGITKHATYPTM